MSLGWLITANIMTGIAVCVHRLIFNRSLRPWWMFLDHLGRRRCHLLSSHRYSRTLSWHHSRGGGGLHWRIYVGSPVIQDFRKIGRSQVVRAPWRLDSWLQELLWDYLLGLGCRGRILRSPSAGPELSCLLAPSPSSLQEIWLAICEAECVLTLVEP